MRRSYNTEFGESKDDYVHLNLNNYNAQRDQLIKYEEQRNKLISVLPRYNATHREFAEYYYYMCEYDKETVKKILEILELETYKNDTISEEEVK